MVRWFRRSIPCVVRRGPSHNQTTTPRRTPRVGVEDAATLVVAVGRHVEQDAVEEEREEDPGREEVGEVARGEQPREEPAGVDGLPEVEAGLGAAAEAVEGRAVAAEVDGGELAGGLRAELPEDAEGAAGAVGVVGEEGEGGEAVEEAEERVDVEVGALEGLVL